MNCSDAVRLVGHQDAVTCMAIANSSGWLVSGSDDTTLRIWNTIHVVKKLSTIRVRVCVCFVCVYD